MASLFGLSFESREEREQKEKEYARQIFPYGDLQKEKLLGLLSSIFPEYDRQQLLLHYILMKEALILNREMDFARAIRSTERKTGIKNTPQVVAVFHALLEADLQIDEQLDYPAADKLTS